MNEQNYETSNEQIRTEESKRQKKHIKRILTGAILATCVIVAVVLVLIFKVIPERKYEQAMDLKEAGKYYEAIAIFEELDGYKYSKQRIKQCKEYIAREEKYNNAIELLNAGKYEEAYIAFGETGSYKDSQQKRDYLEDLLIKESFIHARVGDHVIMGQYEQSIGQWESEGLANPEEYYDWDEDIEWLVLDVQDNKVLLISKYVLDYQRYSKTTGATWENSSLRTWLNNDFINTAFSEKEKSWISTAYVSADPNPAYDVDPGNDTKDQVFVLSVEEVNRYFHSYDHLKCENTRYSDEIHRMIEMAKLDGDFAVEWWLRSPGCGPDFSAVVNGGSIEEEGQSQTNASGVRPAIWIDLDKLNDES